ncbi:hypothetical protein A3B21_00765 [Candidatus Uhrbacteria bacterium RIFCSPLOWO2_01_FULL_47_24]|uniref:Uncharacterized protein n=1 Tax=Candidatus Uhrbacteria bacterium RIFCSPLOWO2_01_FULL_47_24 TaxID=1802401 RepID=A0A1F7UNQ5_9BACT|nr:MAG: hypothetical protein A3D58_04655 [Candidatus Uhrbacteria bacterium RIFCSPHIGHO2_02_FULL_46_47]OGL75658.1 MAG: hypothetical protein A3F52_04575 [Candidatus Uhrbacteria bacterium RIFCSPHIGHO2_12_FULL_47_11]OGL79906.1 MAG: hypothetical protein A3B21_00765 [Candidatus Uhrbacteria bacterium RIFCSPLOWO2_01_FULL_47_24]OGL84126.1 MAG: hypothetical protein A3J03_03560 [Candidatus Uhrbacteria bacterium RIFCSPLOWO2_02_FULL_46_25]OGL93525.1 MAG: hypothetical protein A3H11_03915 [Candidatus Uhrbacte
MATAKKTKSTARKRVARKIKKSKPLIEASALGVSPDQLVESQGIKTALFSPMPLLKNADEPPVNLPVAPFEEKSIFHRPLVSGRTSFWLGVGFGMFIVGVLTFVAWKLLTVETVDAVVVGLGK